MAPAAVEEARAVAGPVSAPVPYHPYLIVSLSLWSFTALFFPRVFLLPLSADPKRTPFFALPACSRTSSSQGGRWPYQLLLHLIAAALPWPLDVFPGRLPVQAQLNDPTPL